MRNIILNMCIVCTLCLSLFLVTGCDKLPLYKNVDRDPVTLNPQQGVTAWEYLNKPRTDTLFNMMIRMIKYAGMEAEYQKPDRTYVLLAFQAVTSISPTSPTEGTATFFGRKKVNGLAGKKVQDYSKAEIANLLKYHIIEGYHTFGDLTTDPQTFKTLRTDSLVNTVTMNINNTSNYNLQFNNFPRSFKTQNARTSNLQMKDNCVVHVVNSYLEYGLTP